MTMITFNEVQSPIARVTEALRVWLHRRETRAELQRLSERELNDIGMCRADIDDVVKRSA